MIKVMLCDDMESIRNYFRKAIESQTDMKVVCTAASGKEAVQALEGMEERMLPDIILMDIQMEDERAGITATGLIHEKWPKSKILMLTIHQNDDLLIEAYLAGAVDYLVKDVPMEVVCNTLRDAYRNENFVGTVIREKTRERLDKNKLIEVSMVFFVNKLSKLTVPFFGKLFIVSDRFPDERIVEVAVFAVEADKQHAVLVCGPTEGTAVTERPFFRGVDLLH